MAASNRHRIASGVAIFAVILVSLFLFQLLHHRSAFDDLDRHRGGWPAAIAIVLGSAIIHELLHVIVWRRPLRLTWSGMGFGAQMNPSMSITAHRVSLALPLLLLALAPIVAALLINNGLLLLWGLFFLLECFSDITLLFALR
ncbi:MAG: hypothetical protein JWO97_4527 [Acidobacteria bacterium]|nr:hypothetical protein [Acidobacteriota bacterium]